MEGDLVRQHDGGHRPAQRYRTRRWTTPNRLPHRTATWRDRSTWQHVAVVGALLRRLHGAGHGRRPVRLRRLGHSLCNAGGRGSQDLSVYAAEGNEAEMAALAGLDGVPEGVWSPFGDPRVSAIIPMAGDAYLFDAAGLSNVTVPMMAIGGTADTGTPYDWGSKLSYDFAPARGRRWWVWKGPSIWWRPARVSRCPGLPRFPSMSSCALIRPGTKRVPWT